MIYKKGSDQMGGALIAAGIALKVVGTILTK